MKIKKIIIENEIIKVENIFITKLKMLSLKLKIKLSDLSFMIGKILCSLGFHKGIRSQLYETGEIIVICKYCRKELD